MHGFCYQEPHCIYCRSKQWLHKHENVLKINRQGEGYCQGRMPYVTWAVVKVCLSRCFQLKTFLSKVKPQQKTTLFCLGSFVFSWHIVSSYLFFFFFSDKTTVEWYFIVGPFLAVTVLAFIALHLWKRRTAGTYPGYKKFFCILNTSSQWKTPNVMHYIVIIRNSTTIFCSQYSFERRNQLILSGQ